jgi:hypothetical protein
VPHEQITKLATNKYANILMVSFLWSQIKRIRMEVVVVRSQFLY